MKIRKAVSLNPKPRRERLCVEPAHQVDLVDVAVDAAQLLLPDRVRRQLLERAHRPHVQQLAELRVARDAALARAQDVGRAQVHEEAVRPLELLEEARIVVQHDRPRVGDSERVERVRHRDLAEPVARVEGVHLWERELAENGSSPSERNVKSSGRSGCIR